MRIATIPQVAPPMTANAQRVIARQKARDAARDQGHQMGLYRFAPAADHSTCRECGRSVYVIGQQIAGTALIERCEVERD